MQNNTAKIITSFKEDFGYNIVHGGYNIVYGGEVEAETGTRFDSIDDRFFTLDSAKLCCRLYATDIETGALEEHPDVIRTFLQTHPDPVKLLKMQLKSLVP